MMSSKRLLLIGWSGAGKWRSVLLRSLGQLVRNPVILAIVAGVGVALLEIPITGPLARTINMLAMSSTAVALFVIGGSLVGLQMKGMRKDVSAIALGKLLLHPLVVGLLIWLMPPSDATLRAAAVVFAAMPMLSIYPILAQAYGEADRSATTLLICMVTSFFTLSAGMWVVR